jgi:V8-like Glu-specific endopeptidase
MATHRFFGDRHAPTLHPSVREHRALQGTGARPSELERMAGVRTIYSRTDTKDRPNVVVESVDHGPDNVWKIDVPVSDASGARPGRTLERHAASKYLDEIAEDVSFGSYRPEWIDALPVPDSSRAATRRFMRRLDGRVTEPLWVYDSHRSAFVDDSWPWGLVGRIFNSNGFSGTGSLIGDRLVITAGHMVPWGSGPWWIRFVPAYVNGTSLFGAGVESYVSDARGYDVHGNVTGYDWAILRLYEPLGSSLGYFGYNGYSDSWNDLSVWSNIGYPGDIDNAQEPAFQKGYTINDTDGDDNGGEELETEDCDLNHGNSGGPIFAWWNNGTDPRIVGVVSGQETEYKPLFSTRNDNVFASGGGFTGLCAWGRANWPA